MKISSLVVLGLCILCELSLSEQTANRLRSSACGLAAPSWKFFFKSKEKIGKWKEFFFSKTKDSFHQLEQQLTLLQLENFSLKKKLEILTAEYQRQNSFITTLKNYEMSTQTQNIKRQEELQRLLQLYSEAIVGHIIFREIQSWSSSFWVDIGDKINRHLGKTIVGKNSPVVVGNSVIGLVEYVDEHRSRIRLITDPSIILSVRSIRDQKDEMLPITQIHEIIQKLYSFREDNPFLAPSYDLLQHLLEKIELHNNTLFLAKGELRGANSLRWGQRKPIFHGVGFNYDFEDEKGPARDLRTGQVEYFSKESRKISLIQKNDLIITTGMDGVFPSGLYVGKVLAVHPLQEGDFSYSIDVVSLIDNFENLSCVTILPPLD